MTSIVDKPQCLRNLNIYREELQLFRMVSRQIQQKGVIGVQELVWIQKAVAGDREAMEQLLLSVEARVYKTAFFIMGNEHDARDAAQEVLLKICHKLHLYEQRASFQAWAVRITTNHCIDLKRKMKPVIPMDEPESEGGFVRPAEDDAVSNLTRLEMREAMNRLPEQVRNIVVMRFVMDYSYQTISEHTNLPLNTVKSHIYRARAWLTQQLKPVVTGEEVRS